MRLRQNGVAVRRLKTLRSTNDVPQRNDIVVARGRQAERRRLQPASAVVERFKEFDNVSPDNAAAHAGRAVGLAALRRADALRPRIANAVELRGIRQRGLTVVLLQRHHHRRVRLPCYLLHRHIGLALPVQQNRQQQGTQCH